jgi:hypothetical protein
MNKLVDRILKAFGLFLGFIAQFVRLAIGSSALLLGLGLVFLYFQLKSNPDFLVPDRRLLSQLKLLSWVERIEKLGAKVTRSTRYTVLADNMHRMRLMLNSYTMTGAVFPTNVNALYKDASEQNYWWGFRNPFENTLIKSHRDWMADYQEYQFSYSKTTFKGKILYEPIGSPPHGYRIYGCDEKGELVKHADGSIFLYTNMPE